MTLQRFIQQTKESCIDAVYGFFREPYIWILKPFFIFVFRLLFMPCILVTEVYESVRDNVGTRSVLFGVHQVFIHPIFVAIAWIKLYGWYPNGKSGHCCDKHKSEARKIAFRDWPKLIFCFIVHDWGYYGKPEMDGPLGDTHPELGAKLANKFLDYTGIFFDSGDYDDSVVRKDTYWYHFCLCHSRHYAKQLGLQPSKLCMADKLAVCYYPLWLYIFLGKLTGEIYGYLESARANNKHGYMLLDTTNLKTFMISLRAYLKKYAFDYRDGKLDNATELKGVKSVTIDGKVLPGEYKVYIGEPIDNSDLNALLAEAIRVTKEGAKTNV